MADTIKFIYAENKETFNSQKDTISESSIVFINDVKQIWTHGLFYSCPYTAEEINNLFNGRISALEGVIETEGDGLLFLSDDGVYKSPITVNNTDDNIDYKMMFHSNNALYSTTGIYCNPSDDSLYASSFYETSDINLKTNIESILNSDNCPIIRQFSWKENGNKSYGFIALELEKQGYTELVNMRDDGVKTVNYSAALSLVVGKMLAKIEKLELKILDLENKLANKNLTKISY